MWSEDFDDGAIPEKSRFLERVESLQRMELDGNLRSIVVVSYSASSFIIISPRNGFHLTCVVQL